MICVSLIIITSHCCSSSEKALSDFIRNVGFRSSLNKAWFIFFCCFLKAISQRLFI